MRKRLLSALICIVLLVGLLPTTALAGDGELPDDYTTNEKGIMSYTSKSGTTIDIMGNYKGNWIQTTYDYDGYEVATDGVALCDTMVTSRAEFINEGRYIQLTYTVTNNTQNAIEGGKLAVHADVMIGENDSAAIEVIQDGDGKVIGLKMVDDSDKSTKDAQFNLYFDGAYGVTPVTTYWFGFWNKRDDDHPTYGHIYFAPLNDDTKSSGTYTEENGVYTKYSDNDSGFAISWHNIELTPSESKDFSVIVGVGEKADPPEWSGNLTLSADINDAQNELKVNVSAKVTDKDGLTDTLYYSKDDGAEVSLGKVTANGNEQTINGTIDMSTWSDGTYTLSFWVVNSNGAISEAVTRTITISGGHITSGLDDATPATYTVTFNMNGHGDAPAPISNITSGGKIDAPTAPTESGYTFGGWYTESACENVWNFDSDTVTSNITLYAKWTKDETPPEPVDPPKPPVVRFYTVSFDSQGGSRVYNKAVEKNDTVAEPKKPTRAGYVFVGWFTDRACTNRYDFDTKVTKSFTLYAKWRRADGPADPTETGVADWLNTTEHTAYLGGYQDGTFAPDREMTRAEAAQMFYNLLVDRKAAKTVRFDDVPATAWYAEAVHTLASLGIIEGMGHGRFEPDRPITRAEFTVIAMRFAKPAAQGKNSFRDVSGGDWFYEQVTSAAQYGWICGYSDGSFRPQSTITRAEVTAIVNRMLARSADRAYVDGWISVLRQFSDVPKSSWAYYEIMEAANAQAFSVRSGEEFWG